MTPDLIARIEAATAYEEAEVFHEIAVLWADRRLINSKEFDRWMILIEIGACIVIAMEMVPEDPANKGKPMLWSIAYDEDGVGGERGYVASLGNGYHDPQFIYGHSAATPALALLAAALKARQAQEARTE